MKHLWPKIERRRLPAMLAITLVGALMGGAYGAIHDQLSFAISPEYFTRVKFVQFRRADLGLPSRLFASEVGILAAWWAGMFAGWFLARCGLDELPGASRAATVARAFGIVLGVTIVFGVAGGLIGLAISRGDLSDWEHWRTIRGVRDLPSFVTVAWMHASEYAGALVGLIVAIFYVRRTRSATAG